MFEKVFPNGKKVIVDAHTIAIYETSGEQLTNSNVDYYYAEEGFGCKSEEDAADQYFKNFGAG